MEILGEELHRLVRRHHHQVLFGVLVPRAHAALGDAGGHLAAQVFARIAEDGAFDANPEIAAAVVEFVDGDGEEVASALNLVYVDASWPLAHAPTNSAALAGARVPLSDLVVASEDAIALHPRAVVLSRPNAAKGSGGGDSDDPAILRLAVPPDAGVAFTEDLVVMCSARRVELYGASVIAADGSVREYAYRGTMDGRWVPAKEAQLAGIDVGPSETGTAVGGDVETGTRAADGTFVHFLPVTGELDVRIKVQSSSYRS